MFGRITGNCIWYLVSGHIDLTSKFWSFFLEGAAALYVTMKLIPDRSPQRRLVQALDGLGASGSSAAAIAAALNASDAEL